MSDHYSFSLTHQWSLPKPIKRRETAEFEYSKQEAWSEMEQDAMDSLLQESRSFDTPKHQTEFQPVLDFLPFDMMLPEQQDTSLDGFNELEKQENSKSIISYFNGIEDHISMTTIPSSSYRPSGKFNHCTTPSIQPTQSVLQSYPSTLESNEKTVIIMTSKVAQKSYGTEKRFLCPPPTAMVIGSSWWTPSEQQKKGVQFRDENHPHGGPPTMTICISGENSEKQSGRIEWYDELGTVIGQTGGNVHKSNSQKKQQAQESHHPDNNTTTTTAMEDWFQNERQTSLAGGRCVLKRLYISDTDEKKKKVECLIKLQLANGHLLGTLSSRAIKVISKPSKKRQSVKNVELCIYHGTLVSLFNRIRSQTVSTKYLGVSSTLGESCLFDYPGRHKTQGEVHQGADTCFVARTGAWDPFIIWIVGPPPSTTTTETTSTVNDYIGCASLSPNIPYPNPPTIALKNKTHQPLAVRYNQHVVLQCLTTGLVSPVMIIRKVDKASTVVGGARCPEGFDVSFSRGGEMGDEVLGDPVSQLHKVALQIVQPETSSYHPSSLEDPYQMMPQTAQSQATYLACLNDMVGTRKTANKRSPIKSNQFLLNSAATRAAAAAATVTAALPHSSTITDNGYAPMTSDPLSRQRRASLLFENASSMGSPLDTHTNARRRISSASDTYRFQPYPNPFMPLLQRSHSISVPSATYEDHLSYRQRRNSHSSINGSQALAEYGAYWSEDVTDAAVWTIVGTECAIYTFWTPPQMVSQEMNDNIRFPYITHMSITQDTNKEASWMMTLSGEYFSRDLQVWLGDIKATYTEYKSRDMLVCGLPSREELLQSMELIKTESGYSIRLLLVRKDGLVYKTNQMYSFHQFGT